jgi:hypothetical protein
MTNQPTDDQLSAIMAAAQPLHPCERDLFLRAVAEALREQPVVDDGLVGRVAREVQREFLRGRGPLYQPPKLEPKYARDWVRRPSKRRRTG